MAEEMVLEHAAFSGLVDRRSGEIALEGAALSGGDRCADEIGFHIRPVTVPDTPLQLALKRTIDAAAASLGLVVLAPVLAVAAVLIRLDSKGPILVRQLQTGLNEVPFEHLSFRCEYENRESGNRRANLQANARASRGSGVPCGEAVSIDCRNCGMFLPATCRWSGQPRTFPTCWLRGTAMTNWCRDTNTVT